MRRNSAPTKYPGVKKVGKRLYRVRVKVTDPKTGRSKEIDRIVEADGESAAAATRERLRKEALAAGDAPAAQRTKLRELALSWLRGKLPTLKASTREHYAAVLDVYVLPELGDYYLDALTADDVIAWRDAMKAKPPTVNSRLRVLKTLLADVCAERGLHNPAARVQSVREPRRKVRKGLEPHELAAVLAKTRELTPRWYPIALTLAVTGQRWGAVSALEWSRVDFERGEILFTKAHVRGTLDDQKTGADVVVPLVPELREVLLEHRVELRRREKRRRERANPGTTVLESAAGLEGRWVFPSRTGGLMQPSSFRKPLAAACRAAGVPVISPHGLRYSFNHAAKRVAERDVVRSITGHVTEEMTQHYDWIRADEKRSAVAGVVALITRASGGDSGGDASAGTKKPGSSGRSNRAE